ncbi:hypothetical protein DRO97_08015 [Archaeoglobales archaeon]|nr:MAG: hypothetical protein DRO97_08015 [Archaeoglobales archaeon]
MKILYIAPDVPIPHTGKFLGGSTHVLKVAECLAEKGCKVFIISRRMVGQSKFEKIAEKIVTRRFYRGLFFPLEKEAIYGEKKSELLKSIGFIENLYFIIYRLILTIYIIWLLFKYRFDIVIERNSAKGIGVLPAWLFQIQRVVEVIDSDFSKIQLGLADRILAYTRNIIPEVFQNKVILTYAGVDINLFKCIESKDVRERYGLSKERVVVYVGESSEWHGADRLLGTAEMLKSDKVKFLMIGKQLEALRRGAERKGIADKFVFVGFVPHEEVPKFISAADVGIAPYKLNEDMQKKGFYFSPIKIFEYMACGKPVIASDLDIIREVILSNRCGMLAKPGDAKEFAMRIKMLSDRNVCKKMGKNGKKAVLRRYTWDKVADKILRGYYD